jgi:hypothetical protein
VNARRVVKVNEAGLRIGEDHHHAKLSDREVELLLLLHVDGWGYRRLAVKFDISRSQARHICKGEQRAQTVGGHRVLLVHVPD